MGKTLILTVFIGMLLVVGNLYAQSEPLIPLGPNQVSPNFIKAVNTPAVAPESFDKDTPAEKFGNGVMNVVTSWTDIPAKVVEVSQEEDIVAGSTMGLAKGVVSTVARGVSGTYDAATCVAEPYNKPAMAPEYKVQNPNQDGLKVALFQW